MVGDVRSLTARKKRPPLVTPEQAVQAAYQLIAEEGPTGLSMRKLAAALHVSLPTVYTAIRSKDHLVGELQDQLFTEITASVRLTGEADARQRLVELGRALFRWAEANPPLAEFLLAEDLSEDRIARSMATVPEPGRSTVLSVVADIVGHDNLESIDPVTSVLFASAVSRAVLALARAGRPVDGEVWLQIWSDTVGSGLRTLATRPAVAMAR